MDEKPTAKKRGRKPILIAELVASAITELKGNLAAVASRFNVARSSVVEFVQKHATLMSVLSDARESRTDLAEDKLGAAIENGEAWAVCFYLKTQGKSRGYVERQELTGKDGGAIRTEIAEEIVDADAANHHPPASDPGSVPPQ